MDTRWKRYYKRKHQDPDMKKLVEEELGALNVGIQISRLREKRGLNQTQLAARAGMSAPKISVFETSARNIELGTLIRLAQALDARLDVQLLPTRERKPGRPRPSRAR